MFLLTMHITFIKIAVILYILNKIKLYIQIKVLKTDERATKEDFMDIVNMVNPSVEEKYIADTIYDVAENNKILVELMAFVMCFVPVINILMIIIYLFAFISKSKSDEK